MKKFPKMKMPKWMFRLLYCRNKVAGKIVFFDTNCYRGLGRKYNRADLTNLIEKIKKKEKRRQVDVRLSYLVASEMFSHLADPVGYNTYQESRLGLLAAIEHISKDQNKFLAGPDSEIHKFLFDAYPQKERINQRSLYDSLIFLSDHSFDNYYIETNTSSFLLTKDYLQTLKDSWVDSFIDHFIKNNDPGYTGGWILHLQDEQKRNKLLKRLNKAEENGDIFTLFAIGTWLYIVRSFQVPNKFLYKELVDRIKIRFDPVYRLQLRIMKMLCAGGYNLEKRQNDVVDFLITVSLDPNADIIFVSNETANLVPTLQQMGYGHKVMSLNEYFKELRIKERL